MADKLSLYDRYVPFSSFQRAKRKAGFYGSRKKDIQLPQEGMADERLPGAALKNAVKVLKDYRSGGGALEGLIHAGKTAAERKRQQ